MQFVGVDNLAKRIRIWCESNHNIIVDLKKDVILYTDDGITINCVWNLEVDPPTQAALEALEDLDLLEKNLKKSKYPIVRDSLPAVEPKFALVYMTIKKLCIEKLNMTEAEYDAFAESVYQEWVDS